ncbi:conserved protein of unknown function (plasmid) [Rhodovastum atsumiense]|uniref:UDP-N-acetylglucosamine kinase n=1 Tax=Rhodovastum atsumiense TaxID=504468 RepID=A0A5M6IJU3_9PROT|nr:zeta toxin family protein [Rhodovastum atsumiense]KAA5607848.1 hypothetical protein F1189_31820 [Rhodovastum atsumiense]CAH2605747.1 conserved protein of unknown function [Rhodovastum atsumiense]
MTRLLVHAGPNGSGKSSLRDQDAQPDPVEVVIDPDQIARGLNPANPRAAGRTAGKAALTLFGHSLAAHRSISLETTLAGPSVLRRFRAAKAAGYDIELRYVALETVALNIQRVCGACRQERPFIAPADIRRRYSASLANLPEALAIVDRGILADNSGAVHRVVLEMAEQRITRTVPDLPGWLLPLMPQIRSLRS